MVDREQQDRDTLEVMEGLELLRAREPLGAAAALEKLAITVLQENLATGEMV
jgi:hypothetical protein